MIRIVNQSSLSQGEIVALINEIQKGNPMIDMIFEYYQTNGDIDFLMRRLRNAVSSRMQPMQQ